MRHLMTLVLSITAAALSVMACSSDSDSGSSSAGAGGGGGHGGGSGGAALTQCVGANAEFTPAEYLAQTEDGYACSDPTDVHTVCANDLPTIGGKCAQGCLGMGDDA